MNKATIKKAAAVVLAGAMCFGVVGVKQNVTANQNIYSGISSIKDGSDKSVVNGKAADVSGETSVVTGDTVFEDNSLCKFEYDEETGKLEYVYFGSYPQSEVTGDALTEEIINAQYVSGTAVVNGEKYCRVAKEDADYTVYEYADKRLQENYDLRNATEKVRQKYWKERVEGMQPYMYNWGTENYHYFKYEPIKWRVETRNGDSLKLCAAYVLDTKRYWYSREDYPGILSYCGWMSSTLRLWLNDEQDGFLSRAFNSKEQAAIQTIEGEASGYMYDGEEWKRVKVQRKDKVALGIGAYKGSKYEVMTMSDYAFAMGTRSYDKKSRISRIWVEGSSLLGDAFSRYIDEYGYLHSDTLTMPLATRRYYYVEYSEKKGYGVAPEIIIQMDKLENLTSSQEPAASESVSAEYPKGDVNGDFIVDLGDARLALRAALHLVQLDEEQARRAAVTAQDGFTVTLKDVQVILRWALNLL